MKVFLDNGRVVWAGSAPIPRVGDAVCGSEVLFLGDANEFFLVTNKGRALRGQILCKAGDFFYHPGFGERVAAVLPYRPNAFIGIATHRGRVLVVDAGDVGPGASDIIDLHSTDWVVGAAIHRACAFYLTYWMENGPQRVEQITPLCSCPGSMGHWAIKRGHVERIRSSNYRRLL